MEVKVIPIHVVAFGLLLFAVSAVAQEGEPDPTEIVRKIEDLMRAEGTYTEMVMEVITPDWRRTVKFRSWDDRAGKRAFIQILSPARDKDVTFLKEGGNLWSYLPQAERTIKIPPSMMHQSWMGSDFTNDDLVRESSAVTDYTHEYLERAEFEGVEAHKIAYYPKPDAPVTWGKIIAWFGVDPLVPLRYEFYNRRGELSKEMTFGEMRTIQGRTLPTAWTMRTASKPGHRTVLRLENIEFNPKFPANIFTRQHLRNPR